MWTISVAVSYYWYMNRWVQDTGTIEHLLTVLGPQDRYGNTSGGTQGLLGSHISIYSQQDQ